MRSRSSVSPSCDENESFPDLTVNGKELRVDDSLLADGIASDLCDDLQFEMDLNNQVCIPFSNERASEEKIYNGEELDLKESDDTSTERECVRKVGVISPDILKAAFGDFPSEYNNHFCSGKSLNNQLNTCALGGATATRLPRIPSLVSFNIFDEVSENIDGGTPKGSSIPTSRSNPTTRSNMLYHSSSRLSYLNHRNFQSGSPICIHKVKGGSLPDVSGQCKNGVSFQNLVDDSKIMILGYLSANDVRNFSTADHASLSISRSTSLWTEICAREMPLLRALKRQNPLNHIVFRDFINFKMAPNMSLFDITADTKDRAPSSLPLPTNFLRGPTVHQVSQQHNQDFHLHYPSTKIKSDLEKIEEGRFFLKNRHCSSGVNLSVLLGLSRPYPTTIDKQFFKSDESMKKCEFRSFDMLVSKKRKVRNGDCRKKSYGTKVSCERIVRSQVVQYIHKVGIGDRCVRSNHPFPFLCKKDILKPSPAPFFDLLAHELFSRGMNMLGMPMIKPFVAPIVSKIDRTVHFGNEKDPHRVEIDLTPRIIAYFEVSIFKRDEQQEPIINEGLGDSMDGTLRLPESWNEVLAHESDCFAVGISSEEFCPINKMPGWDLYSYGYHGDDGGIFHASGEMVTQYGPTFGVGDTVGCGIDYTNRSIFYTLNGIFLGNAFEEIDITQKFFPTVGVDCNCPFQCNFGESPFVFDLEAFSEKYHDVVNKILFGAFVP
uniref:B30.2/SPRY domain-containing protein n=1 Tax=Corethron hystrix TaxID=216773 RepID=A0A7S1BCG0_9STRA|mmetsp:Transcript_20491/g.46506  ORF Transcript_20491/g.46506 Transcript_20491/m.46506 type:complete len:717 (+) Transcript_20491:521-2671(+)